MSDIPIPASIRLACKATSLIKRILVFTDSFRITDRDKEKLFHSLAFRILFPLLEP